MSATLRAMRRTRMLVAASAVMYASFGLLGLFVPMRVLEMIRVTPQHVTAINEVRALYGGIELGIAVFLVYCLCSRASLQAGLFLVTALFTGAAAARTTSMLIDGIPAADFVGIWLFESAWAAACIATLSRERATDS